MLALGYASSSVCQCFDSLFSNHVYTYFFVLVRSRVQSQLFYNKQLFAEGEVNIVE